MHDENTPLATTQRQKELKLIALAATGLSETSSMSQIPLIVTSAPTGFNEIRKDRIKGPDSAHPERYGTDNWPNPVNMPVTRECEDPHAKGAG